MAAKKCWICSQPADSAEHCLKQSDVAQLFNQSKGEEKIPTYVFVNNYLKPLQSSKSKQIKYPNSLCSYCNNTFTQPFDFAYSEFIDWYSAHQKEAERWRVIDFKDVYGDLWPKKQLDLFRYFAKAFGCRLSHHDVPVPRDIINILNQESFRTGLYVTFAWNYDLVLMNCAHEIMISYRLSNINKISHGVYGCKCGHTYDCIMMVYHYMSYDPLADEHFGAPWAGGSRSIYLGWHTEKDKKTKEQLVDTVLTSPKIKIVSVNL